MKRSKRILSLLLSIVLILGMLPMFVLAADSTFSDVKTFDWFYNDVKYVCEKGLMKGTSSNTFSPKATTSRGMIVTILYRMAGEPAVTGACSFKDVTAGSYYEKPVIWAVENEVVGGYSASTFDPDGAITREQLAAILYRYAKFCGYDVTASAEIDMFSDAGTVSSYALTAMKWASAEGLINGSGSKLDPQGSATRAQVAAILMRFCEDVTPDNTPEESNPSPSPSPNPGGSGSGYTPGTGNEGRSYTVTFYMNDGTDAVYTTVSVVAGGRVTEPAPPARDGYIFDGWYANSELSEDFHFESVVSQNLSLYASWDNMDLEGGFDDTDVDEDSVPAIIEEILGTSDYLDDTDGDGISDYIEIYEIGSDPTIADSDQDTDGDGISNYDEVVKYGTHAGRVDTDIDGLSDYDELFIYSTDPLIADTDGDGISDGDEIKLGTDPHGETDILSVNQTLSAEKIDEELILDNDAIPSLSGRADTVIDHSSALQASRDEAISSNRAVVGKGVETIIPDGAELTLSFSISDPAEYYVVMELDDETGWELVESQSSGSSISAEINHSGTYCVVDIEVLLTQLGIDIDSFYDSITTSPESIAPVSNPNDATSLFVEPEDERSGINNDNSSSGIVTLNNDLIALIDNGVATMSDEPMGQADIVFAIDTTGSMSDEISNVANNIIAFANTLSTVYNVNVNFALVDYKDIVEDSPDSTKVIKNGRSNWFTTTSGFRDAVASMTVDGGGDTEETAIDALEVARRLDYRSSARKFIVLVTDAGYKVDNNYGISSMSEEIQLLSRDGIITSVVTSSSLKSTYQDLIGGTGGIFANIYGNFGNELLALADMIGGEVNEGNWILLSDYQYVALKNPLAVDSGSTDDDGLSDWEELEAPVQKELTLLVKAWIQVRGVPEELIEEYFASEDGVYVTVYPYKSNPVLEDTDYDGIPDDVDSAPRNNMRTGKMHGCYDNNATYVMDFRNFTKNLGSYNHELSVTSLVFANAVYGEGFEGTDQNTSSIASLLKYHGFDQVIDYSLDEGFNNGVISVNRYTDDDISEIGIGYHDVTYGGKTTRVVAVIVRGTNGTIEEWSSNFDMGDPDNWDSDHHKGFYITEERIKEFVEEYEEAYGLSYGVDEVVYWVTGHSRGAAISNLLAARLIDSGKKVVAYTFATPSTTIDSSRSNSRYKSIFNFANTSDVIAYVPLSQWGFGCYGVTMKVSVEDSGLEGVWCATTGQDKYNALNRSLITTAMNRINKSCSGSWSEVFDLAGKQRITDAQYSCISERARRYCNIVPHDYWFSDDNYELYPSTAFVFQLAAEMLAGSKAEQENAMTLIKELWNSKYSVVILAFVGDAFGDLKDLISNLPSDPMDLVGDGHAPATYYVLIP